MVEGVGAEEFIFGKPDLTKLVLKALWAELHSQCFGQGVNE
ncbi:hypothetical protein HanRHA438_Chr17g0837171 [Helianthus annuus]|uniref:Uncharacterized protein n=1 Tax=Helianthus annuus TaxID=4232 RepID=A0A9K3DNV0_HELAN|nr:hypothetical protein HanXRQr2_Chr17g0826791 [Helianthus annuus]KAJ0449263.1 hypothetical protein HanHA89_Chr17g0726451 [Helianthus annuus]KAJ0828435.1 hypothetical protein HanRHA438_Chr17g0837171 [Helianthus annuus]